jgi:chemotaxis family two-component system response regulator Rcp1
MEIPEDVRNEAPAQNIMLVEDNEGDVYLVEKALQNRNIPYQLTRYEDGEQAMRALSEADFRKPDLILLDLNLPRREGFDVLRATRTRPDLVGVPVGILTASDAATDRHRVSLIGAERYIHKPPTLEEFLDDVGQAIVEMLAH